MFWRVKRDARSYAWCVVKSRVNLNARERHDRASPPGHAILPSHLLYVIYKPPFWYDTVRLLAVGYMTILVAPVAVQHTHALLQYSRFGRGLRPATHTHFTRRFAGWTGFDGQVLSSLRDRFILILSGM